MVILVLSVLYIVVYVFVSLSPMSLSVGIWHFVGFFLLKKIFVACERFLFLNAPNRENGQGPE